MTGKKFIFINIDAPFQESETPFEENVIYVCHPDFRMDFICPCGCREIISLNMISGTKPCWSVNDNTITPSINRIIGCRSHFSIKNGIVETN